jgi:S-DNA-T family DNA segregation ATPase FtsK/SpoIIIE
MRNARSAELRPANPVARDIAGLSLVFAALAAFLWLVWPQEAWLPSASARALRALAGTGAFLVPLAVLWVGVLVLTGRSAMAYARAALGPALLFLAFVGWRHLTAPLPPALPALPEAGAMARPTPNISPWSQQHVESAGGYLGALLGEGLSGVFGLQTAYLLLGLLAAVAVVLVLDRPVSELVRAFRQHARSAAARAAAASARQREAVRSSVRALGPGTAQKPAGAEPVGTATLVPVIRSSTLTAAAAEPEGGSREIAVAAVAAPARRRTGRAEIPPEQTAFPVLAQEASAEEGGYRLPPITLLDLAPPPSGKSSQKELEAKVAIIEQTLEQFNVKANVVEIARGPTVTRYEIQLAPGIKVSKIVSLADNLAMSLAAIDVRLEAPIPGKSAIGVEVPNSASTVVTLRECLDNPEFWNAPSKLTFALGCSVDGAIRYADLAKMPHLLIGGSTNSGKSVCLNALIASLLYRATPREVRFIMIDPKRVELSLWDGIPHLMHPVVKDVKQSAGIFRAALQEMERRYDLFSRMGTRNLEGYNQRVPEEEKLPFIVIVVDELADLMMQLAAEVETSICRLAQLSRAVGIHLVIATQRPSVDVITGTIKANIPSRIAFAVSSVVDSRTILDMGGADRLIGRGDMLFLPIDAHKPFRIQGCFLGEEETNRLVAYLKEQEAPEYTITPVDLSGFGGGLIEEEQDDMDDLYESAVRWVVTSGQSSTSALQRRFKIGYNRAARLIDTMEQRGIVGPLDGVKPREILVARDQLENLFLTGD